MPRETRQIALSDDELLHAIQSYRRMQPNFLPHGPILRTSFARTEELGLHLTVAVRMRYGANEQEIEVRAQEADLLALLIRFCLENNVPVPRRGEKQARIVDGAAVLHIEFSSDAAA